MKLLDRLWRLTAPTMSADAPYREVVAIARRPAWYTAGTVPDTIDGRFDMVVLVLSLLLIRLEAEGDEANQLSVDLTECFIADMDGSIREIGIGDLGVGKHVGRMVGALGGRLGAYREALASDAGEGMLETALVRNLYRGNVPPDDVLIWIVREVRALAASFATTSLTDIEKGLLLS